MATDTPRPKTGGRQKGTPNKATTRLKAFLDEVFTEAFANPVLKQRLIEQIVHGTLDGRVFVELLKHYAGTPAKQVEHNHRGTVNWAAVVSGKVLEEPTDDVDDDEANG